MGSGRTAEGRCAVTQTYRFAFVQQWGRPAGRAHLDVQKGCTKPDDPQFCASTLLIASRVAALRSPHLGFPDTLDASIVSS